MTKEEILNLSESLNDIKNLKGVKFAYFVARNIQIINSEIENIKKTLEPSKEYAEYNKKRIELAKKYSKKDDKGNPLTKKINDSMINYELEDEKGFENEFNKLKEENKSILDIRKQQEKEFNDLLKTESDLTLFKININDVPNEITGEQLHNIINLIEE